MNKKITIELVETDLLMPKHLQRPPQYKIDLVGLSPLDACNIMLQNATQMLASITVQIAEQQKVNTHSNNLKIS